jgi:hypothetical protein
MRFLIACFVVAAASAALPQSSNEFHSRYGEPDLERFQARPGISVTVEYGLDHLACQIVIEPPQPLIHQEELTPLMSSEGVSEILEEVAPDAMRGKVISGGSIVGSFRDFHSVADFTEYDNMFITRTALKSSNPDHDLRTQIIFKRDACPKTNNPLGVTHLSAR